MKIISFLSENFHFLEVKFSIYLNRRVLVTQYSIHFVYSLKRPPAAQKCLWYPFTLSCLAKFISRWPLKIFFLFFREKNSAFLMQIVSNEVSLHKMPIPVFLKKKIINVLSKELANSITKTCLYNFDPLKPHFYIVKLGFTGVYIIFLISAQKYILWVLVRGGSNEYPQTMFWAEIWKIADIFIWKFSVFWRWNFLYIWMDEFL